MDHAEAHELIADLALEPDRLTDLTSSQAAEWLELREHVSTCVPCTAELNSWQSVHEAGRAALADADSGELRRIAAPPDLRRRVLTQAHNRAPAPRRWRLGRAALLRAGVVLAIVVVIGSGLAIVNQQAQLNASNANRQALAAAVAAASNVLADPAHRVVGLASADGSAGTAKGSIAWTRHEIVVLATGLATPPNGQVYRCWLAANGAQTLIGRMNFVDGQAFWAGSLDEWAEVDLGSAQQFEVTLELANPPGSSPGGAAVLAGQLQD